MSDLIKPPGDRKVARMARRCKGELAPFPTFGAKIGKEIGQKTGKENTSRPPNSGPPEFGP